jgi:predicted nucleotide-binding protein
LDETIKNYADSLYETAMHESMRAAREDQKAFQEELATRTNAANLPIGGSEIRAAIKVKVAHIDRCLYARLNSYQKAFDESGAVPTEEDLVAIFNDVQAVQELQIQHSAQALTSFLRAKGKEGDLTGSLREGSAHGHDYALQKWKTWRAQMRLKKGNVLGKFSDNKEGRTEVETPMAMEENSAKARRVWVVHGRDARLRSAMFTFLRSIGLAPTEFSEARSLTNSAAPYVGEILEAAFQHAQAVVVLLTPDDEARLRPDLWLPHDKQYEKVLTGQARPNVLFEAGMALVSHRTQTVLVQIGELRDFSDVGGRHVVHMDGSISKRQEIAVRLRDAGCPVNLDGTDWHTAGDFKLSMPPASATIPPSSSVPEPNLVLGNVWYGTLYLMADIWSKRVPQGLSSVPEYEAIYVDIKNGGRKGEAVGTALQIKAELVVSSSEKREDFSPLPWLNNYFNRVDFQPGDVRRVLLAVGMPTRHRLGDWRIVLNERDDENLGSGIPAMDFDRLLGRAPEAKLVLNLLHIGNGQTVRSFTGTCRWKEGHERPEIFFSEPAEQS